MVVNPADIPGSDKERRSKTDPIDARRMAKALESGMLEGVHVPTEKEQKQRSLTRYRKKLWATWFAPKTGLKVSSNSRAYKSRKSTTTRIGAVTFYNG
jgi:hypothetical protein